MPKISIIISSREKDNSNHALLTLLHSLSENTRNHRDIEVLVKYDEDDDIFTPSYIWPFAVKYTIGEKGRGYIDIHNGYNQLLPMVSPESKIIVAMADDFTVVKDWDVSMLNAALGAGDYFIIHQRKHPPITRENFIHESFDMSCNPFYAEELHIIDEAPAWSKAVMDAVGSFPVSFTDAWTLCLERVLWFKHDIKITKFIPNLIINRTTGKMDQPDHPRWGTDRKWNFEYIKSEEFKDIVERQGNHVAMKMREYVKQ